MITERELKKIIHYDEITGMFEWIGYRQGTKKGKKLGQITQYGYLLVEINGRNYRLHRLAWFYIYGYWPKVYIDHINGIKTDNRICNLREADRSQNMQNQKKAQSINKTGLLGVYPSTKSKTFRSIITINNRRIELGSFKTKEEAHEAYIKAKREIHPYGTL